MNPDLRCAKSYCTSLSEAPLLETDDFLEAEQRIEAGSLYFLFLIWLETYLLSTQ